MRVRAVTVLVAVRRVSTYETDGEGLLAAVPEAYYSSADDASTIDWELFSDDLSTIPCVYASMVSLTLTWSAVQAESL